MKSSITFFVSMIFTISFLCSCGSQRGMQLQNGAGNNNDLFPIPSGSGNKTNFEDLPDLTTRAPTNVDPGIDEDSLRRDFADMFTALSDSSGRALDEAIQILSLALAELVVDVGKNSKHIANLVPLANSNSARIQKLEARKTYSGCRVVQGNQATIHSVARCADNEQVVSGGMHCESRNPGCGIGSCSNLGFVHANRPGANNDWVGDCYGANGKADVTGVAFAVCCPK